MFVQIIALGQKWPLSGVFVRYFPIMEDTQIKTQTPKMSLNDLYCFCVQSLMATLNLLATNVTYVIQQT